jgi:hypothetical protein
MGKHGAWQITLDGDTGAWVAVRRPTPTAQDVLVARSVAELDAKLDAEDASQLPPPGG